LNDDVLDQNANVVAPPLLASLLRVVINNPVEGLPKRPPSWDNGTIIIKHKEMI